MSENPHAVLGRNIRKQRNALGLSQEKASEVCGVHRTYFASVERGERNITIDTLLRFARALETTPARLLRGVE